jgi:hypothetical protein
MRITHYVLFNGGAHFVKEVNFFIEQKGLILDWGKRWRPVEAKSIEHARQLSTEMDWTK